MPIKKLIFQVVLLLSFLIGNISVIFAESVAVKGDLVFIADGGLVAKNLSNGQINQCLTAPLLGPEDNDVTDLLQTATDVAIDGDFAVVTVHPETEAGPVVDVVTVDISSCLVPSDTVDVEECISTVDLDAGVLIIPCIEIDGSINTVHMDRRGNSSNWEVSFFGDNPALDNFQFDDDDDGDNDDDDDD